jgi:hypothetical protein
VLGILRWLEIDPRRAHVQRQHCTGNGDRRHHLLGTPLHACCLQLALQLVLKLLAIRAQYLSCRSIVTVLPFLID